MTDHSFPGLIESSAEWLPLILLLGKLTLLLVVAWSLHAMLWKQNPRWRVLLWRTTALSIPLVIALQGAPAVIHWPVLPTEFAQRPAPADTQSTATASQAESPRSNQLHTDFGIPNDAVRAEHSPQSPSGPAQFAPPAVHADASEGLLPAANGSNEPAATRATIVPAPFTENSVALCLLLVWALVFLSLLGRTLLAQRWLTRLVRRSQPAPPHVLAIYRETAEQLSFCQAVTVLHSDEVRSPCVAGIFRPVILLPSPQCAAKRAAELPAILAHELAHLRQHDLIWNTFLHGISLLLWFQPLCWRMRAAHALACDGVADAVAADHLGDVSSYSRTLARLAVDYHNPAVAATMGMSRASHIRCRIERLNRRLFRQPLSRRNTAIALLLGLLATLTVGNLAITAAEPKATQDSAAGAASHERPITVFVTTDGHPLEGVTITVFAQANDQSVEVQGTTSSAGDVTLSYETPGHESTSRLVVAAKKPGFVGRREAWDMDIPGSTPPEEIKIALDEAQTIGGTVRDAQGNPLPDTRVVISYAGDNRNPFVGGEVKTNAAGEWRWDTAPLDPRLLRISYLHAGYVRKDTSGSPGLDTIAQLAPGQQLQGRILANDGTPVSHAQVAILNTESQHTDSNGRFRFDNIPPTAAGLSVWRPGYALKDVAFILSEEASSLDVGDILLTAAEPLQLRIVNEDAEPLKGAQVTISPRSVAFPDLTFRTNAEGSVTVPPVADLTYFVWHGSNRFARGSIELSDTPDHVITLRREPSLTGSVLDDHTGLPINDFALQMGGPTTELNPSWSNPFTVQGTQGLFQYRLPFSSSRPFQLHVTAPGYAPAFSSLIQPEDLDKQIHIKLQPAPDLSGVVLTPEGQPAAGAKLAASTTGRLPQLTNGELNSYQDAVTVFTTDEQGRYSLPPLGGDPALVMVVHDSGFVQLSGAELAATEQIHLRPWGQLAGQVLRAGQPVPHVGVEYRDAAQGLGGIQLYMTRYVTTTDDQGRFHWPRVVPGKGVLSYGITTEMVVRASAH